MWNKVEFSDLYKFITSIGLFFIASAFLIPWLFLNQITGLQIHQKEYDSFTSKSKTLFNNRIDISLWIVDNVKYIFWILITLGVLCIVIGLYFWIKKQRIKDQIEEYSRDKLKFEVLNPEATDNKREKDVKEELSVTNAYDATQEKEQKETKEDLSSLQNINKLKRNLENVENRFFDKIKDYNPFNYQPQFNVRIDNYIVDILLKSSIRQKYQDIYIEIKFFQQNLNFELFKKSFGQTVRLRNHLLHKTNQTPKFYLFIVYKNDIGTRDQILRFKKAANEYLSQFSNLNIKVVVLNEDEIENYDIKNVLS